MSVEIPSALQPFVQGLIQLGWYESESDVVIAALSEMQKRKEQFDLEAAISEGFAQCERGECYEIEGDDGMRRFLEDLVREANEEFDAKSKAS